MRIYWLLLTALGLFHNALVMADDTEIYVSNNDNTTPNVIFLMDTSGSMGYQTYNNGESTTRLAVVQQVAADVITNTSGINIAIGRFNENSEGGRLSSPLLPIENTGVRAMVREILYDYTANGGTPLTEALYEMSSYYRGAARDYGSTTTDYSNLCMVWSQEDDDDDDSDGGTTEETVSVLDPESWWYSLIRNGWSAYIPYYYLTDDQNSWKDYDDLRIVYWEGRWVRNGWRWSYEYQQVTDDNAYYILQQNNIGRADYGQGSVPWFVDYLDTGYWTSLFDFGSDSYRSWDDLPRNLRRTLRYQGVNQSEYQSLTTTTILVPTEGNGSGGDSDDSDSDSTEGLVCEEYLNLDDVFNGNTYVSPITDECQSNHIVVFTDGEPNGDNGANTEIRNLLAQLPSADFPNDSDFSANCSGHGGCAEELAYSLYHGDASESFDGDQPIYVHTIGGFIGGSYEERLSDMATYGGGVAGSGSDADSLRQALTSVFNNITESSGTFAAPAVTVNAFNNLEHLDQLYYSVFSPSATGGWTGNIKRYRLDVSTEIRDVNNDLAVDETTGYFADNARSYWTLDEDAPDGENVTLGGAARRLTDPDERLIVTNLLSNNLTDSGNRITPENTALATLGAFNALSVTQQTEALYWLSGYDTDSANNAAARTEIEDPLHSRPLLLTYGSMTTNAGDTLPDTTMFVGTNSGYLHAFDTNEDDPKERFAFLPKDLMSSALAYYQKDTSKTYGLDGRISYYHIDENNNDFIDSSEVALLYVGMRRGGRNYYALDVSDRDEPKLAWQISGGDDNFEELGQSWSEMTPITILWNGQEKDVLVFGGGYDEAEDEYNQRTDHSMGNAIYMVDPITGELLWKASKTGADLNLGEMTSGFANDIVPVDYDGDRDIDILYAADLGGRIWRFDLAQTDDDSSSPSTFAKGGVVANLGSDNTEISNVRFFSSLDVSYIDEGTFETESNGQTIEFTQGRYQLVIGSGYRAHPLNTTTVDNIYFINDFDTTTVPDSYPNLQKSDLADLTNTGSSTLAQQRAGAYYKLTESGEKVLSDAITMDGYSYVTSYKPEATSARSGCEPDIGESTVYRFRLVYNAGVLEPEIDIIASGMPGIVDTPVVIRQEVTCDSVTGACYDADYAENSTESDSDNGGNGDEEEESDNNQNGSTYTDISEIITFGLETVEAPDSGEKVTRTFWRELQ
ncbi:PilC/PilY family type IV pilus protein [Oceanobacter kriegii]|uniref:PilC/PilY family type IV pilus protein n=1 Tax=Oceanobacter kriegii TaxID=64972 RepID=UPI000408852A|nr:PilC/PilY family type IV pilus protein [Oceanobacter kriegii]